MMKSFELLLVRGRLNNVLSIMVAIILFCQTAYAEEAQAISVPPWLIKEVYTPQGNTVAGNPRGRVIFVDFFDYNCGYCRILDRMWKPFLKKHPEAQVVFKEYLVFGSYSKPASYGALAAERQGKYLEMHEVLLNSDKPLTMEQVMFLAKKIHLNIPQFEKDIEDPKIAYQIMRNAQLAETLHFHSVPKVLSANSMVLVNDQTEQFLWPSSITSNVLNKMILLNQSL